jgi:hypothetical protein
MGDLPPPTGTPNEYGQDGLPTAFHGPASPGQPLQLSHNYSGPYQSASYPSIAPQNYASPQHAFSSQIDTSAPGRGNPYNMNAMMNALPQQQYRSGQYPQSQPRFSPQSVSTSTMQNQVSLQHQQYEAQSGLSPMANQQYYLSQHAGAMPQYYSTSMSPPQSHTAASTRNNMGYYPSPVILNQHASAAPTYYYPQAAQYGTSPANAMSTHLMPAHYMASTPPQPDPRMAPALPTDHYGTSSYPQSRGLGKFRTRSVRVCSVVDGFALTSATPVSLENRQNIVRGPPRKPRQSGKTRALFP